MIQGVRLSIGDLLRKDALRPSLYRNLQIEIVVSNAYLAPYYLLCPQLLAFCLSKRKQNGGSPS